MSLVGTAAFKAVCGAVKVLAGFDSQTFPHPRSMAVSRCADCFWLFLFCASRKCWNVTLACCPSSMHGRDARATVSLFCDMGILPESEGRQGFDFLSLLWRRLSGLNRSDTTNKVRILLKMSQEFAML